MLSVASQAKIFCCQIPTDMRKGFEGLSFLVNEHFEEEVISGSYFIFINRSRDRMKALYWDGDGLAIWYKRLERGRFVRGQKAMNRRELLMMLEGIEPKKLRKRWQPKCLAKE